MTAGSRADENPRKRPEATQECPEHETGRVHKEHLTPSRVGLTQERLQLGVEKFGLGLDVLGQVFLGGTGIMRTR
jgi:hypothetical protein